MYRDIIFKCNTVEDIHNCEEIGNNYGWSWIGKNQQNIAKYSNVEQVGYIIFSIDFSVIPSKKIMFYGKKREPQNIIDDFKDDNGGDYEYTDNINNLKFLLSGGKYINYNEPKKLVYENKILKYNNFKDA